MSKGTPFEPLWLNDQFYITLTPGQQTSLQVWRVAGDKRERIGAMDYKFHRDGFASFIYRLLPTVDLMQIHQVQKRLNPYFDLEV
ncbi:hypothetical protein [Lacticaseibacillus nasuensis]|uniref:hypothetical protein n=1 Tax=Lacticaseibacillus nasuensis TaxID=944671 RepID=UPI0006D2A81E|nr:hypothetical protein [Lacticaseibacillus nasuensis]MCX2455807.1 hypothetical protein [Lacticaseibacillus nasuensis]